jgi:hypothetical protein
MPVAYNPTPIDFSALAGIGQDIGQGYQRRDLAEQMKGAIRPDGIYDYDKMIAAIAGKNPIVAAQLATRKAETDADNEYRRGMLAISQHKANQPMPGRIVNLPDANGVLQPFERSADGQITPVQAPGVGQRYKPMGVNDITKLSEEGGKAKSVAEFAKTFSDDYGGFGGGFETIAQLKMLAGRTGWADEKQAEASVWWQGYDKYKNKVRNDLFGSALTPQEAQQWEKADVNPAMDPAVIRKNLELQGRLIQAGLSRKTQAMKSQGYNPQVIDEAYGIQPGQQDAAAPPLATGPRAVPTMNVRPDGSMTPTRPPIETPALKADVAAGGYGKQPMTPASDKIDLLKQHANNPEARKAFDEIYGPGASEFYLTRSR